ncbi:multidrug efflux RND transporter outer membrane subunit CmeD [Campylobacter jejuni]|uniref:multidrug efflux RND transporter outer membrane subunit CmeD n=1 Tax=Campylobacter jejuni TaxID=197 RepID=UPI00069A1E6F|nr:multidrug efflux RND transporter outer membrane subunit CmeD [Campylobacter jejuni]EAI6932155.1 multidrug efflux RND transporter outer membrane subunit CmeD [Campylobacter jejuni]ECQ5953608.1 multidrug efflux RND transporter outer membrane subunit CmeD [Campylobacter jejuni]ELA3714509.1 multidrug efflux RND transporter outer membrane subunit CmeD [Campylobacter jejuni]KAJ9862878.1 multidrug efflux RND transporter outer membrane subunit CmeD [Campylobacter jejuni]KAJ9910033.1 multidrug efflu
MFEKYLKSAMFLALYPLAMLASNLHEFIALSQNNESYLIKQMQSKQANLDKEQAFRNYLPSLSLNSAYVANNKDRFIIDPQESLFAKVSLNFLLFDGGAREANLRALESKEKLSFLDKEQNKNYLALNAITLYFNTLSLEKILLANQQKIAFLKSTFERLQKFYDAGLSPKDELESIKAKYHLSLLELSQNELKLANVQKEIKILSDTDFKVQGNAFLENPQQEKSQNYEVMIAKEQINLAKENVNLAKAEYFPKFYIQDNFNFYKNNYNPKVPAPFVNLADQFLEKYSQGNQFILGMEWKIFDFNARAKEVEKERLNVQIANANARFSERKNKEELNYLDKSLKVLQEQILALNLSLNAANLAFESIDKKYQAGLVSYVEYLQALEAKFKAQSDLELAKNEFEITKANYYFNAGIDLNSKVKE